MHWAHSSRRVEEHIEGECGEPGELSPLFMVHLFADPLVHPVRRMGRKSHRGFVAVPSLKPQDEQEELCRLAESAGFPVDFQSRHLAPDSLGLAVSLDNPDVLHISAHGIKYKEGVSLVLEDHHHHGAGVEW